MCIVLEASGWVPHVDYAECSQVSTLCVGIVTGSTQPLILVGGNFASNQELLRTALED